VPERDVGMLPADLAGSDAVELGCGTGYVSSWLARRGARVTGIDNSSRQLATARRLQREHGVSFRLVHGDAERLPLRDASADFAVSEYGACLWADPHRWVPEAARVLRPGGRLHFLVNSALLMLCMAEQDGVAAGDRLLRPAFGMHRVEWPGDPGVEFHLATATGSGCCARTASRSTTSSSCVRRRTRGPAIPSPRSTGRAAGRPRRCGRRAASPDPAGSRRRAQK
jgi:SAM-dependent methyltransferase